MTTVAADSESAKVLVIDDEVGPRESLRYLLDGEYRVLCEESVDSGLTRMRTEEPDLVILDIKMPVKGGMDGLREIRAADPDVSVIMLTGYGSLHTAQEAVRLGASDYLTKPFDARLMRDAVKRHVAKTMLARRRSAAEKSLEESISQLKGEMADKDMLVALGQASCELAHDLSNPLTAIQGYVELLREQMQAAPAGGACDVAEWFEVISRNLRRCRDMLVSWRSLLAADPARLQCCTVSRIVRELAENCGPLARERGAALAVAGGPPECEILCDPMQIMRALENVVRNALQAVPRGAGRVTVGWSAGDGHAEIRVEDNGPGIDPAIIGRAFEPYMSTKANSGGLGLGLFVSRKIVEQLHGGSIAIVNRGEGGVAVSIRLPLPEAAKKADRGAA